MTSHRVPNPGGASHAAPDSTQGAVAPESPHARPSRAAKPTAYLVIIEGAGEYQCDYSVLRLEATSPQDAIDQAIAPEMGYGKHEDGTAFVVEERHVSTFTVNDTRRSVATPTTEQVPL